MRILLITNLYPPQELGGYGRCMADFAWGLQQRGHRIQVLCSNAPYLGASADGPSGEPVSRCLQLKGSFEGGVRLLQDPLACAAVDQANRLVLSQWLAQYRWDGVLLGNVDMLGLEPLAELLASALPVLHHVGFVAPPFAPQQMPRGGNYQLLAASHAVRQALVAAGLPVAGAPVVYPGARVELFGGAAYGPHRPLPADGSPSAPLKVCFAGLLMATKGAHTLVEALVMLHRQGVAVQATLAGGGFQAGYRDRLEAMFRDAGVDGEVRFVGQLTRPQLARFFSLHHACVFPSIYPEAFGIVGAEAMASGVVLVSSGVGGAAELIEDGESGLFFQPGDAASLAAQVLRLVREPGLQQRLAAAGEQRVRTLFSVDRAAEQLEGLFTAQTPLSAGP